MVARGRCLRCQHSGHSGNPYPWGHARRSRDGRRRGAGALAFEPPPSRTSHPSCDVQRAIWDKHTNTSQRSHTADGLAALDIGQQVDGLIADRLDGDASPLDQQRLRVLDQLLDLDQELHRGGSAGDTVSTRRHNRRSWPSRAPTAPPSARSPRSAPSFPWRESTVSSSRFLARSTPQFRDVPS